MLGDSEWLDLLRPRYEQHLADSARWSRMPELFDRWATEATWRDFVILARLVDRLPPFTIADWRTENPVPGGHGGVFRSRILARRLISALVLVAAALDDLRRHRKAYKAVQLYLASGRVIGGFEFALADGKRLLFEWFCSQAQQERAGRMVRA